MTLEPYYINNFGELYCGDCLEVLSKLSPVDLVLTDMPYGNTMNVWDIQIPLDCLWKELEYVRRDDTPVVFTAQTPFDKILGCSNLKDLKYEWIWEKTTATGHLNAKKMPMKAHENILVFYRKLPTYNPQKTYGHKPVNSYTKHQDDGSCYGKTQLGISGGGSTERYPRSIQSFATDKQKSALIPTQKPIALFEYLIRTYTNEGDVVLDFCGGSGTAAIAAQKSGRKWLLIEKNIGYCAVAAKRIDSYFKKVY
jgi:site-specific DNA-methyltransferase (adenine-specific)